MRRARMTAAIAMAVAAAQPAAVGADDRVVATVARPTTVDARGGHAVWSAWDPVAGAYRLTEYSHGRVRMLQLRANRVPFDADLGADPFGGTMAVFSRCARPPLDTWALDGRRGCDLYYSRLSGAGQVKLRNASSSGADEYWPTVWRGRIAFTRIYKPRGAAPRSLLYWRPFRGEARSHRLRRGPVGDGAVAEQLDMRGRRVTFVWKHEFGGEVRLATVGGDGRRLVRIPGSGAAANTLAAHGPSLTGSGVSWMLSVGGDAPVYSEFRGVDLAGRHLRRATARVDADPALPRATEGFAQDGDVAWYVRAVAADRYEIHRVTGLTYEPAPPIEVD